MPPAQSPRILLIDAEEIVAGVTKVNLRGRLDATAVQAVATSFAHLTQSQDQLIVDLSRVTFIASTGLRTLITGARAMAARDGKMVLLQPDPSVEAVLISSGVDQVIPVAQTLAEAVCAVCAFEGDGEELPLRPLVFALEAVRAREGVARVGAWVDELCILLNLSQRTEYALRLSLEEIVTRIIDCGEPEPGVNVDRISLRLVADAGRLSITVQDRCAARNPLLDPPEATDDTAPDGRRLGTSLLTQHARDLTWSRVGHSNRIAFTIPR